MRFAMTALCERGLATQCLLSLSLILSSSLLGCHAQKPEYAHDPEGVNRSAKPQIMIKKEDVYLDGHLIRIRSTTAEQAQSLTGKDPSNQTEITALFNATGLRIHAGVDDQKAGHPNLVHAVQIWVRPEKDYGKHQDCDEAGLKRHQDSIRLRLESIERDEKKNSFSRDERARAELLSEGCTMAGKNPEHAFTGYLEVDGMPIGPNMSLKEIQARRKRLGLQPLYENSGPQIYIAPAAKTGPFADQTWIFEVTMGDGGIIVDQRLKAITIP
jgi:hypothetical protein